MTRGSSPTFDNVAAAIRRELRRYARDSILTVALELLQRRWPDATTAHRQLPWLTALLVKWTCLDGVMPRRERPSITESQFLDLRQRLWDAVGTLSALEDDLTAQALMRRLMNPQLRFQTHRSRTFLIEPVLIGDLEETHTLRRLFREQVGVDERTFIDLALFFQSPVHRGVLNLELSDITSRLSYPPLDVEAFLRFVSRSPNGLVTSIRATETVQKRVASELLDFPVIARYPFLREGTVFRCWHPKLYHHGIAECVHETLGDASRGDYTERYGKVLEAHVIELAKAAGGRWISERELRPMLPPGSKVTEGLISFDGVNVLIESKAALFPQSAVTAGDPNIIEHKTVHLMKAIEQGRATSAGLRSQDSAPSALRDAAREYLLIVTNRELLVGTGRQLLELHPAGKLSRPPTGVERPLPLDHVFVMSIDDYEWLMEAARCGRLALPDFLAACVARNAEPRTARQLMDQHLETTGNRMASPKMVEAIEAGQARLRKAAGVGLWSDDADRDA